MSSSRVRVIVNSTGRKNDKEKIERFLCVFFVFVFCFFLILFLVFLFGKILSCVCVPFLKGRRICLFRKKVKFCSLLLLTCAFFDNQPKRGEKSQEKMHLCCVAFDTSKKKRKKKIHRPKRIEKRFGLVLLKDSSFSLAL